MAVIVLMFFSLFNASVIADDDKPDLIIVTVSCPDTMMEDESVDIVVKVKNDGNKNISGGTRIGVGLYLDSSTTPFDTFNRSGGLDIGETINFSFSWTPSLGDLGQHLFRVVVDYRGTINELDENNNVWDKYIDIVEKDTNLEIVNLSSTGEFSINEPINISADIINTGKDAIGVITAQMNILREDDLVYTASVNEYELARDEWWNVTFEWTPQQFGTHVINMTVFLDGGRQDWEVLTEFVKFDQLLWWNENWHYRMFIGVTGTGNGSFNVNFTELLGDLDIFGKHVENTTIRIIHYATNGSIIGEVEKYRFDSSANYNDVTNALGTLTWNVTETSKKYYAIYFDVTENDGVRTASNVTGLTGSGDVTVFHEGSSEGWWAEIILPMSGGFFIFNDFVDLLVNTTAKAKEVKIELTMVENVSHSYTINLTHLGDNITWNGTKIFTNEDDVGAWIAKATGKDGAGFTTTTVERPFTVGLPDLSVENIELATDHESFPIIYDLDTVNITGHLWSGNATVHHVDASLLIVNKTNYPVYHYNLSDIALLPYKQNNVSFSWQANQTGDFSLIVTVDPDDDIIELDETNNRYIKNITVEKIPDLAVVGVVLPTDSVIEAESATLGAVIENEGLGTATDYEVRLYCEPVENGGMSYSDDYRVASTLVTVAAGSQKDVSFVWNYAKAGEWIVGVKIIVNDVKRDLNVLNNQLPSNTTFIVKSRERNPPNISSIAAQPDPQEQGGVVVITAAVTDDSGMESVEITIKDPINATYDGRMFRVGGDQFRFEFNDTLIVGIYKITIVATDISIHRNWATKSDYFEIVEDETSPVISYVDVYPTVQLQDDYVNITCIATDNMGIESVGVIITLPNTNKETKTMDWHPGGKYVNEDTYDIIGKYSFYVVVTDKAGNEMTSESKTFWITIDLEDTDSDSMPDWWEEKYNLNPENPADATMDRDGDGYTNLKEYQMGTNPAKDIFLQNAAYKVRENRWYFAGSVVLFVLLLALAEYGRRRRSI